MLDWADDAGNDRVNVVVGFSGSNAEVEWQLEQLDADDWIASKAPKHDSRYFNGAEDGGPDLRCCQPALASRSGN